MSIRERNALTSYFIHGGEAMDDAPPPLPVPGAFLHNPEAVLASWREYQAAANSGRLASLAKRYTKPSTSPQEVNYYLSPPSYKLGRFVVMHGEEELHVDGRYLVQVGVQDDTRRKAWVGGISFIAGNELAGYFEDHDVADAYADDSIAIVQLQGIKTGQQEHAEFARHAQQSLKLSLFLLAIGVDWSDFAGLERVFVLPSGLNDYYAGNEEQFRFMYDVTATRYRDDKQRRFFPDSNDIYTLEL